MVKKHLYMNKMRAQKEHSKKTKNTLMAENKALEKKRKNKNTRLPLITASRLSECAINNQFWTSG